MSWIYKKVILDLIKNNLLPLELQNSIVLSPLRIILFILYINYRKPQLNLRLLLQTSVQQ